jgi:hypothetical protein
LLGILFRKKRASAERAKQDARDQVAEDGRYSKPARQGRSERQSREQNCQFVESHSRSSS